MVINKNIIKAHITDDEQCAGCWACHDICPSNCISLKEDKEGFCYPYKDLRLCTNCNLCKKVCSGNPYNENLYKRENYAAKSKDSSVTQKSSSSGFANILASCILDNEGKVFGAAWSEGSDVEHICADKSNSEKLRGSKYVQSIMKNIYKEALDILDTGCLVLFTGTPCQVGAFKNFVNCKNKAYSNIIYMDILCHGVPSAKAWKKYISEKGFKTDEKIKVTFRDKATGWANADMVIKQGNNIFRQKFSKSAYGRAFTADIMLRPSCSNCKYKNFKYSGDITVGDFWGIESVLPDFYDEKGTSAVMINTEKGKETFKKIAEYLELEKVEIEDIAKGNSAAVYGAGIHKNRIKFYEDFEKKPFEWLVNNYVKDFIAKRVFRHIKKKIIRE